MFESRDEAGPSRFGSSTTRDETATSQPPSQASTHDTHPELLRISTNKMPAYVHRTPMLSITDFERPGEQHLNSGGRTIINPFEEVKPRISEYTAQEIATLQSKLEKQLGPEYISSRQGPGGGKVHYVAAEKCIQLANEVFGFNGWSSQIKEVQVDFVDENAQTLKVSLGLSVIVRVTLRDGTFHEDIGYGHIENCKGKAAAFEKAKKEGTTDGLKRALRSFGNVLGNCIYDKEYLAKVTKVKIQPARWDVANLHRHADHIIKKEPEASKMIEGTSQSLVLAGTSICKFLYCTYIPS
jgi:DNA repair and recombination protein RAD52